MASKDTQEEFNMTEDEVERLKNAMKNEEFRKLLAEYAEEISNPENKARYEQEIAQMEGERGMDVKFVNPEPGYVIKTSVDGKTKAFINICKNENIEKPSSSKGQGDSGQQGLHWQIPHSFSPPREDLDKLGNSCKVFDVVFHPDAYRMSETNQRFKKLLNDTAVDGIERQFDVKLDRNNMKFPKMKFKGLPVATVIRTKNAAKTSTVKDENDILENLPYPYDDLSTEEKSVLREEKIQKREQIQTNFIPKVTEPKYSIVHRAEVDLQDFRNAPDACSLSRPKELVITIELPLIPSASSVNLETFENRLVLESQKPAEYKLELALPYPVDESEGNAKFDKSKRQLVVTLPVIKEKVDKHKKEESVEMFPEKVEFTEPGDVKPLIEVLSSVDSHAVISSTKVVNECKEKLNLTDDKNLWPINEDPLNVDGSLYHLPPYDFQQDDETVTLVISVPKITNDSISKTYVPAGNAIHLKFVSLGAGCFPMRYSLYFAFPEECTIDAEKSSTDASNQNLVLTLVKSKQCQYDWQKFSAGKDPSSTEEQFFVTEGSLKDHLDQLEGHHVELVTSQTDGTRSLTVTEMNEDKFVVKIPTSDKENSPKSRHPSIESGEDIKVVHEKGVPKLHGILKQRSRHGSESSEDVICGSPFITRENSISSHNGGSELESPVSESEESSEQGGKKRTVSFSESIDQTTYKNNNTVSSFHQTLKNKKKKLKKREQAHAKKAARRQRRISGGSEPSSSGDEHDNDLISGDNVDGATEVSDDTSCSGGNVVDDERTCDSPDMSSNATCNGDSSQDTISQMNGVQTDNLTMLNWDDDSPSHNDSKASNSLMLSNTVVFDLDND